MAGSRRRRQTLGKDVEGLHTSRVLTAHPASSAFVVQLISCTHDKCPAQGPYEL